MPGRRGRGTFLIYAVAALAFLAVIPAAGPAPAEPRPEAVPAAEARAVFQKSARALRLQTELPIPKEERGRPLEIDSPPWALSETAAHLILWGAVLAIVLAVLWNWRGLRWSDSRSRRVGAEDPTETAEEAVQARLESARTEADELAGRGLFTQAMHVLLLQSVGELRRRLDVSIAASLTSREILARLALPPVGRGALADIVGRVELCYFGTREPGAAEYAACRRSFEALTEALHPGGVA